MAAHEASDGGLDSSSSSSDQQFYSRQYYVYGAGAMEKLRSSRVLLIGVGKLGAEIAKNLVLSGVSSLLLFDPAPVTADDLRGHLWISPEELSAASSSSSALARSRAQASLSGLQELNPRCSVQIFDAHPPPFTADFSSSSSSSTSSSSTTPQRSSRLLGASEHVVVDNNLYHIELEQLADVRPNCVVCSVPNLGRNKLLELACYCRVLDICFVHVDVVGLAGRLFCNFGEEFQSLDPLGEHREDVLFTGLEVVGDRSELLVSIAAADARPGVVAVGDLVKFGDIPPASQGTPLRSSGHLDRCLEDWTFLNAATGTIVEVMRKERSLSVRVRLCTPASSSSSSSSSRTTTPMTLPRSVSQYFGSGSLRFLPKPALFHHQCLSDLLDNPLAPDMPILQSELTDSDRARQLHVLFCSRDLAIDDHCTSSMIAALPSNHRAVSSFLLQRAQPLLLSGIDPLLLQAFYATSNADLPPLNAFFGGFAAQEVIKAVTQKYSPLTQLFYLDLLDLLDPSLLREGVIDSLSSSSSSSSSLLQSQQPLWFLGRDALARLQQSRVFLVGSGAIGCELLKNLAMLGVGEVTVTDDDAIEQSNLNRQFLFRDSDIGKLKSEVACARVRRTATGTRFTPLRLRVQQSTEHVFTDDFYRSHSLVLNALDNVPARLYVDGRCVATRVPMIDSGTLGTQGHVQVVMPALTESYASQSDPENTQQIPMCTLKSFPHNITHCIEWARDLCFEKQLLIKPTVWNRVFFFNSNNNNNNSNSDSNEHKLEPLNPPIWSQIDANTLSILSKLASSDHERLPDFASCVRLARAKFDKYFDHDPRKLLELFPVDHVTAEGEVFWAPPRRIPQPLSYLHAEPLHAAFVFNFTKLLAAVWGVAVPFELDSQDAIARLASDAAVPRYSRRQQLMSSTPSVVDVLVQSRRSAALRSSTPSLLGSSSSSSGSEESATPKRNEEAIALELQKLKDYWQAEMQLPRLNGIEFDKDDPSGTHVGLVAAAANLRAAVYGIEPHDLLSVKRIAGRILPAIAATTSCVSGVVCFELLKHCKQGGGGAHHHPRREAFRNAWLNLAVPALMLSEPAAPVSYPLGTDVSFTLWDAWDIRRPEITVSELIDELTALSGGLAVGGIVQGARVIFFDFMHQSRLPNKVTEFLDLNASNAPSTYVTLIATFMSPNDDEEDLLSPAIRFHIA